jgi:hypothetical protein
MSVAGRLQRRPASRLPLSRQHSVEEQRGHAACRDS